MPRRRRKTVYYDAISLFDGTVMAAEPMRKPSSRVMKRDRLTVDSDGVCRELLHDGKELRDVGNENRFRFMDIISTSLNTRRALREIVLPALEFLREDIAALQSQLDRIERAFDRNSTDQCRH